MTEFDRYSQARSGRQDPAEGDRSPGGQGLPGETDYWSLLREAVDPASTEQVDWEAFHARINARATLALAALRRRSGAAATAAPPRRRTLGETWWECAAGWGHAALPTAVAAGIALVAVIHFSPEGVGPADVASDSRPPSIVADAGSWSVRTAFESAVIGGNRPRTVVALLVPMPVDSVFLGGPDDLSRGTVP
jgi:hypothetical protein